MLFFVNYYIKRILSAQMADARITFYSVAKCGFYRRGEKAPNFGGVADTFEQLAAWSNGLALSLTKLTDQPPDADTMPVYVLEMTPCGTGWILGCWNEVPSADGNIPSVSKNSIVGAPQVHLNGVIENSIPGYATYFWIVPEKNVVASIKFSDFTTGLKAMKDYISDFLSLESKYAIDAVDAEGQPYIAGYTDKPDKLPTAAKPKFQLQTFKKGGRRAYLLENHARIRKVLRVGRVTLENVLDRTTFQSLVRFLRGDPTQHQDVEVGVHTARVELQYTPTRDELNAMIEADDVDDDGSRWEDLGFELAGEDSMIWLNRSRASDTFVLNLDIGRGGVVNTAALAKSIADQRAEILQLLEDV
jgi:hypothetical protein